MKRKEFFARIKMTINFIRYNINIVSVVKQSCLRTKCRVCIAVIKACSRSKLLRALQKFVQRAVRELCSRDM